jgi:tetratricopeptide (TPR) repeat protein
MLYTRKKLVFLLALIPFICLAWSIRFRLKSIGPLDIAYVRLQDYNSKGQYHEMQRAYKRLATKYPTRTELLYPLGWAYYKTGHIAEAYDCMRQYMLGNPYYPEWQKQYIKRIQKAAMDAL